MDKYNVRFQAYVLAILAIGLGAIASYYQMAMWSNPSEAESLGTIKLYSLAAATGLYVLAFLKYAESKSLAPWLCLAGFSMLMPPLGVLVGIAALYLPDQKSSLADVLMQAKKQPLTQLEPGAIKVQYASDVWEVERKRIHDPWGTSQEVKDAATRHVPKPIDDSFKAAAKPANKTKKLSW